MGPIDTNNPLTKLFSFATPSKRVLKPVVVSRRLLELSQKDKMIGVAERALAEISFSYQKGPKKILFQAPRGSSGFSPQLYCVNPDKTSLPQDGLKTAVGVSSFLDLDKAIINFVLEAHCHVYCDSFNENIHLWLHTLIDHFQNLCQQEASRLSLDLESDFFSLGKRFNVFYEFVHILRSLEEVEDRALFCEPLKELDELLLDKQDAQEKLEALIEAGELVQLDLVKKTNELEWLKSITPHLVKIVAGFYASFVCGYLPRENSSFKVENRAYVPSYNPQVILKQAIQVTCFINNKLFTPLAIELKSFEKIMAKIAFGRKALLSIQGDSRMVAKAQVDLLISNISEIKRPVGKKSEKLFEVALMHFFSVDRSRKWDFLSKYITDAYFHLFSPAGSEINNSEQERYAFRTTSLKYISSGELYSYSRDVVGEYLSGCKKSSIKKPKAAAKEYLNFLIEKMAHIADVVQCPFNQKLWLGNDCRPEFTIVATNGFASASLKKFSDVCEFINGELNAERRKLAEVLKKCSGDDAFKLKGALDETCQELLKEGMSLITNPNFVGRIFYYIRENGLLFEGGEDILFEINVDSIDLIIEPLMHLGLCPPSFLDLFEWRLEEDEEIVSEKKVELAQVVGPIDAFDDPLAGVSLEGGAILSDSLEATFLTDLPASKLSEVKMGASDEIEGVSSVLKAVGSLIDSSSVSEAEVSVEDFASEGGAGSAHSAFLPKPTPAFSKKKKSDPAHLVEVGIESNLSGLVEQLNDLMKRGAKTKDIFVWLDKNGFEYLRHRGSHAIYRYKTGHVSIPSHTHLKPGILCALRQAILAAFTTEGVEGASKKVVKKK